MWSPKEYSDCFTTVLWSKMAKYSCPESYLVRFEFGRNSNVPITKYPSLCAFSQQSITWLVIRPVNPALGLLYICKRNCISRLTVENSSELSVCKLIFRNNHCSKIKSAVNTARTCPHVSSQQPKLIHSRVKISKHCEQIFSISSNGERGGKQRGGAKFVCA